MGRLLFRRDTLNRGQNKIPAQRSDILRELPFTEVAYTDRETMITIILMFTLLSKAMVHEKNLHTDV